MQTPPPIEHTIPLSPHSSQYTVRESYQPAENERIVHVDCIAAGAQRARHSGVSAPIYELCRHETIPDGDAWIEANRHHDYVSVTLLIERVEYRYNAEGHCDCETHSIHWIKYFHKDVPLMTE